MAVVTGAGGVLCSQMARALAQCGAKVAPIGRTLEPLQTVADTIKAEGGVAVPYTANVLDRGALTAAAEKIHADLGLCDILLNGAGGNIINISSMNAYTPLTKIPAYSGAKAAINNFTQWLAVHFSHTGIRVNAIAPGFFSTKQNAALLWNADGTPTARTGKILAATPVGRFGKSEELLGTLLYLVNDEAAGFVTGVVIPVDGGFSAYSGV